MPVSSLTGRFNNNRGLAGLLLVPVLIWGISSQWPDRVEGESIKTMTVAGISMSPTFRPGDKVKVNKAFDATSLKNGDLVAVQFKTRAQPMLKRVLAMQGDDVVFIAGRLKLNGQWLDTAWWPGDKRIAKRHYKILSLQLAHYDNRIPKGNLIVMGDNSARSFDSGDYGMVSMSQLEGRVTRAFK